MTTIRELAIAAYREEHKRIMALEAERERQIYLAEKAAIETAWAHFSATLPEPASLWTPVLVDDCYVYLDGGIKLRFNFVDSVFQYEVGPDNYFDIRNLIDLGDALIEGDIYDLFGHRGRDHHRAYLDFGDGDELQIELS